MPRAPARAAGVVGQPEQGGADVGFGVRARVHAEQGEQRGAAGGLLGAVAAGAGAGIAEQAVHVHVDQPGGVVGALDVAAGPEQCLGHPAEQLIVHWRLTAAAGRRFIDPGRSGG
jgi:hypothetical protein